MRKFHFYSIVTVLVIVNSFLLSHPNLVGRLGIIFYRHYYLRDFPRTLLTVTLVIGVAIALSESIQLLMRVKFIGRTPAKALLYALLAASFGLLAYVALLFSSGTYSHTGVRFGMGALLLPVLLIFVFIFGTYAVGTDRPPFPESSAARIPANDNFPQHDDRSSEP